MSVIDRIWGTFFLYLFGEIEEYQINFTEIGQCYGQDLNQGSLETSQIQRLDS
jgi:hypothetical protein